MIPLRESIPSRTAPAVNYAIIAACTVVFVSQYLQGRRGIGTLIERYGMIPLRVMAPDKPIPVPARMLVPTATGIREVEKRHRLAEPPFSPWITLVSSNFLHGGWLRFIGNMWFLYIFGGNVEDRLGHVGYAIFYLVAGVAANAMHLFANEASGFPTVGAGGAIAGVMGAHVLLYPRARVVTLVLVFYFLRIMTLPAYVFLGIWLAMQLFPGAASIGALQSGGVDGWAHIGGLAVGAAAVFLLRGTGLLRPPTAGAAPETQRVKDYRVA